MESIAIKKGHHYAHFWKFVPMWEPDYLAYEIIFTPSCEYFEKENVQLTEQINKLFGFTLGLDRHKNSIRFGWNYDNVYKRIALYSYIYINGQRQYNKIGYLLINKPIIMEIKKIENCFCFICNNKIISKVMLPQAFIGFRMNPFFGGKASAPHDITINMRRIKKSNQLLADAKTTAINILETIKPVFQ